MFLRVNASLLVRMLRSFEVVRTRFESDPKANEKVSQKDLEHVASMLAELRVELESLTLQVSVKMLDRISKGVGEKFYDNKKLSEALSVLGTRVVDELETKSILFAPEPVASRLFQSQPYFGAQVQVQFPSASFEVDEAGKCLALQRYNATMFHLMRVLEIQIRSLLVCLGLPPYTPGPGQTWGALLNAIKGDINRRGSAGWIINSDKALFEEIYGSLDAVRAAWRNPTMHISRVYTSDEVAVVFDVVKMLSQQIAARIDEAGQPLA